MRKTSIQRTHGPCLLVAIALLAPHAGAAERVIEQEVVVNAPRADVYEAFTTTEGVTTFFAPNAKVELRYGGRFEVYFAADAPRGSRGSEGCKVVSYIDGRLVSFTWSAPPHIPEIRSKRTFVVVEFADAAGGNTRVRLTNGGYGEGAEWDKAYEYFREAWPAVLANLVKRFDSGPLWSEDERMRLDPAPRQHYVYFLRPARKGFLEKLNPEEVEPMRGHVAHIKNLLATNRLLLAGPCVDPPQYPGGEKAIRLEMPTPGIVVFEASDDAEAKRIMEGDPAVAAGVFRARVNRYHHGFARP